MREVKFTLNTGFISNFVSKTTKSHSKMIKHEITRAERNMSCEIYSLSEKGACDLLQREPRELVNHNKRNVTRVYPKAMRVESNNFVPQTFFNAGCQMVAMNYQTLGRFLVFNFVN